LTSENNLINNIPNYIEKIYIKFYENTKIISNLPITIKEIVLKKEKYTKYIKIPFNTIITINK
jgi:hypothetical protein